MAFYLDGMLSLHPAASPVADSIKQCDVAAEYNKPDTEYNHRFHGDLLYLRERIADVCDIISRKLNNVDA
jgi:hypothetical protein